MNRPVPMHDVDDVIGFVIAQVAKVEVPRLTECQREDLTSHLLEVTIRMSGIRNGRYAYVAGAAPRGVYDPSGGVAFSTWLGWQLPRRVIDWKRKHLGDTRYQNRPPRPVSIEAEFERRGDTDRLLECPVTDVVRIVQFRDRIRQGLTIRGEREAA